VNGIMVSDLTVAIDTTYREGAARLWPIIDAARSIILPFHVNSDPDAVGSTLGAYHLLTALGKEVTVYASDGDFPRITDFLPASERIVRYSGGALPECGLLLCLDSSDTARLGALYTENANRFAAGPTIMIDHHVTNVRFGVAPGGIDATFIDSGAAATAEIIYLLARAWDLPIGAAAATCLLAGIYGDTLGLQTTSTAPRVVRVVGDLLAAGADLTALVNNFYRSRPFATVKIWGATLDRAEWCGKIVWSQITPEMLAAAGASESGSGGVINFLTGTVGAHATVLLNRGEGEWRAGLRTLVEAVDVAAIAERFGGGGHRKAAGCRVVGDEAERDAFLQEVDRLAAAQIAAAGG